MNFTVIQRVAGGFGLLIILLIILSITSFNALTNINGHLSTVTDKATPLVVASGNMTASLLSAANKVAAYHASRNENKLNTLSNEFQQFYQDYRKKISQIKTLADSNQTVLNAIKQEEDVFSDYPEQVDHLFTTHKESVVLDTTIQTALGNFEDMADELNGALGDIADNSDIADNNNGSVKDLANALVNLLDETTVIVTDSLVLDSGATITTTMNEQRDLSNSISAKYQKLKALSPAAVADIDANMTTYIDSLGSKGLLAKHHQRLTNNLLSQETLNKLELILQKNIQELGKISQLANQMAQEVEKNANSSVNFNLSMIVILALSAITIAGAVGFWVAQSIRKPLGKIAHVFAKVSDGDMTQTINLKSKDEFGQLGDWLNSLIVTLRSMLQDISSHSEQLSAASEETSAITEQTRNGVEQQKDQINQIATAMSQMTATVDEVSRNAEASMTEVNHANQQSIDGYQVVQDTRKIVQHLSEEIDQAATVINQLDEYSSNIGAILDVIRGIAEQTNLLALNAAIEAARAGDHGRGFSVVADEVRSLASKTQESTSHIQQMIEDLQQGTRQAVDVMKSSRTKANECVQQSDTASKSLEAIKNAVNTISEMSLHISQSAKEQNTVTQEMHRNIESISEISEQTALGASQTADASHEQSNLANQLQHLVSRFKT